jgi:hypothetical protein
VQIRRRLFARHAGCKTFNVLRHGKRRMSLPSKLLAAVIILVMIFVFAGGGMQAETGFASTASNCIAKVAISGAAVVALVALVIRGLSR